MFQLRLRCSEQDLCEDILLQICHFLLYIFIFSGRIFWQQYAEGEMTIMPLKMKNEDAGEIAGALGNTHQ
jgi:hypothetical protein